ncbi:ribosome small subunit-dependent GTPase A [bacterium]|nr:ribosome small subunit-dependent GTPase A [bacterium]
MIGQIYKIHSDSYYVQKDGESFVCKIREVLKKQKEAILTGDYVDFEVGVISKILPRKTFIKRPAVANVDQIVVVSALKQPDLDYNQLNRYVALAKYYKIPVVLCFNKEDLGSDDSEKDRILSIYEPLGYKIVFTSALEKSGIENFKTLLNGKLSALCGNSGVGKSSLVNALNPNVNLKTKAVSEKLNRGTHTTRHCEIVQVDEYTRVVDTPGFSNVRFDFILPHDVDLLFDEMISLRDYCKYGNCLHINEDGCAVLKNIEQIAETRYESYIEFVNEAFEYKEKVKYNGRKQEAFHKIKNNKVVAKISEKKRRASRNTMKQHIYKEIDNNADE